MYGISSLIKPVGGKGVELEPGTYRLLGEGQ